MLNLSPESITQAILHKKWWPLWFTEWFWIVWLYPSQIEKYVWDSISRIANREINTLNLSSEIFNKLQDLKHLYSIHDDYWYDTDNLEYSQYYSSFVWKNYLDLLLLIQDSSSPDWVRSFHYYFALLDYIQDDIDNKWLVIWFQFLNE